MLSSMRLCSNVPAQFAIAPALRDKSPDTDILPGGRIYERREAVTAAINAIPGVSAVKPESAFYIFPKIDIKRFNITDDEKFALDFLREKHILVVHGKGFNYETPDHFRIVFLPEPERLRESARLLGEFLNG
jgi:alanine-synthesizing transaminase